MLKFIRQNFLIILILLGIVLIIASIILKLFTQSPISSRELINNQIKLETNYEFNYSHIEIPIELTIYQASKTINSVEELAPKLASKLELLPTFDIAPNYYQSNDQKRILKIKTNGVLLYEEYNKEYLDLSFVGKPKPSLARAAAENFIQQIGVFDLEKRFELSAGIPKFADENYDKLVNDNQANIYEFDLTQKLDGVPLISHTQTQPPAAILVFVDGVFNQASFYPQNYEFVPQSTLPSQNLPQIESKVKQGLATFIDVQGIDGYLDINKLPNFDHISVNKAALEYRINSNNNLVIPYIHFSGIAASSDKQAMVEFITPAIATTP